MADRNLPLITFVAVDAVPKGTPYRIAELIPVRGSSTRYQLKDVTEYEKEGTKLSAEVINGFVAELNSLGEAFGILADQESAAIIKLGEDTLAIIQTAKETTEQSLTNLAQKLVNDYNTNHDTKFKLYNDNDIAKIRAYNENDTKKTSTYNNNATTKINAFNKNASDKTNEYNTNASEKYNLYKELSDTTLLELTDLINIAKTKADLVDGKVPIEQLPPIEIPKDVMTENAYVTGQGTNVKKVDHALNADSLGGNAASLIALKTDVDNAIRKAIDDSWAGEY